MPGRAGDPGGGAEWLTSPDGHANGIDLGLTLRPVDRRQPVPRDASRPVGEDLAGLGHAAMTPPEAGPPPVLGPLDQVGPQGIPLDIAADGQEVLVALHGERLETPLVKMVGPRVMIVCVPAHGVRVREPADEGGQLAVGPRPQHHVPMIGHQAVGQQTDRAALPGLGHHGFECFIVPRFLEQRQTGYRPIQDVVDQAAGSNTGLSRHGLKGSIEAYGS